MSAKNETYMSLSKVFLLKQFEKHTDIEFSRKAIVTLLKKLASKESEVDSFIACCGSQGRESNTCVTITRPLNGRIQITGRNLFPHVVYVLVFRWSDTQSHQLTSLNICKYPHSRRCNVVCVNPYHYDRFWYRNDRDLVSPYRMLSQHGQNALPTNRTSSHPNANQHVGSGRESPPNRADNSVAVAPVDQQEVDTMSLRAPSAFDMSSHLVNQIRMLGQLKMDVASCIAENTKVMSWLNDYVVHPALTANNAREQPWTGPQLESSNSQLMQPNEMSSSSNLSIANTVHTQQNNSASTSSGRIIQSQFPAIRIANVELQLNTSNIFGYEIHEFAVRRDLTCFVSEPPSCRGTSNWGSLVYHEQAAQIGIFQAYESNTFIDGGYECEANKFGLGAVNNPRRERRCVAVRGTIGNGFRLSLKENGDLWIEVYTIQPLFVHGYYLDQQRGEVVNRIYKLYHGVREKIFDFNTSKALLQRHIIPCKYAKAFLSGEIN
ncbi:MH1 domain protein [Dictyocaulus viviparus]|uniref:Mothers against decapentaplegic homolog n=1 Tax=Dictyocaulus viviparus TaxID=29172 RepID=A0A0D8XET4_DICVI|nr:MH1 domain protein [Dictyocaulus viviparus]